jgi:hypothetical protein
MYFHETFEGFMAMKIQVEFVCGRIVYNKITRRLQPRRTLRGVTARKKPTSYHNTTQLYNPEEPYTALKPRTTLHSVTTQKNPTSYHNTTLRHNTEEPE